MTDLELNLLGAVWAAAHFGLRRRHGDIPRDVQLQCWSWVHDLTTVLGNRPAASDRVAG